MRIRAIRRVLGRTLFYLLVAAIAFYTVFPFYWAVVSSLKSGGALFAVEFVPHDPHWSLGDAGTAWRAHD